MAWAGEGGKLLSPGGRPGAEGRAGRDDPERRPAMQMKILFVLVAALAVGALASAGMAVDPGPTTRPAGGSAGPAATAGQVRDLLKLPTLWAKWACVLSGLSLAAILWVGGYSMVTLAKNQVKLEELIRGVQAGDEGG